MRHPAPLPLPCGETPFLYSDARDFGLTAGRLRSPDLLAPHRGIRLTRAPATIEDRATAYNLAMSSDQFFSHTTAAQILGLRLPAGSLDRRLHVTSVAPRRAPRAAGVVGHQTSRPTVIVHFGALRLSHPLQVLLECSDMLELDDLIALGDGLIQRKAPWATVDRLDAAIRFHRGRPGHPALVRARTLMRASSDSPRETALRLLLHRAGFPEPEVNGEIRDDAGRVIAHGDLVYREFATVVEYDGSQHRTDPRQFSIDVQRVDDIVELGWRHLRIDKVLLARADVVIRKVETALRHGGWQEERHPRLTM